MNDTQSPWRAPEIDADDLAQAIYFRRTRHYRMRGLTRLYARLHGRPTCFSITKVEYWEFWKAVRS